MADCHCVAIWYGPERHTEGAAPTARFREGDGKVAVKDLNAYKRRLDAFEYRAKHRRQPRDGAELLALALEAAQAHRFIVDPTDKDE